MCKNARDGGGELAHISHLKTAQEKLEEEVTLRVLGLKRENFQGAKIMPCGLGAIAAWDGLVGGKEV